jgi:mannitol-specific phosphotransferase system IIBC component
VVKEFAVYTVARIALFVASYAVIAGLYMLVARTDSVPLVWPLLVAAVVSAIASLYLLKGPRARFALRVEERAANMSRRFEEARAKEDLD